ncbi:MAG TPA: SDR family NAD(P)-dependent oxidoreductase [Pseudonocardiaceae bacterium]
MTRDDMTAFRYASGDANPLHASEQYARHTAFHEPIAHGVLACLAAIDSSDDPWDGVGQVDVDFRQPVFPGQEYDVATAATSEHEQRILVRDGGRRCFDMTIRRGRAPEDRRAPAATMRDTAADLALDAIMPGRTASGPYGPEWNVGNALAHQWPVAARRLGPQHLMSLMWCSFLSGMEIPGRRGLTCRVSVRLYPVSEVAPCTYRAQVRDVDRRFGLVTVAGVLAMGEQTLAEAEIEAMVLDPAPPASLDDIRQALPASSVLGGRTAAVVGGSRGLGAAVALALADQGCHVLVGHRHVEPGLDALTVQAARISGRITSVRGDATDPEWAERVVEFVRDRQASLDLLVCNAAPAVGRLDFNPAGLPRLDQFVTTAVRLVSAPLSALLPALNAACGRCMAISSSALTDPPLDWPHYVTAKAAVEGLVDWAAAHHADVDFFLARPGMMLTDQTNTPAMRDIAGRVEPTAAALVRRLVDPTGPRGRPEMVPTPG